MFVPRRDSRQTSRRSGSSQRRKKSRPGTVTRVTGYTEGRRGSRFENRACDLSTRCVALHPLRLHRGPPRVPPRGAQRGPSGQLRHLLRVLRRTDASPLARRTPAPRLPGAPGRRLGRYGPRRRARARQLVPHDAPTRSRAVELPPREWPSASSPSQGRRHCRWCRRPTVEALRRRNAWLTS